MEDNHVGAPERVDRMAAIAVLLPIVSFLNVSLQAFLGTVELPHFHLNPQTSEALMSFALGANFMLDLWTLSKFKLSGNMLASTLSGWGINTGGSVVLASLVNMMTNPANVVGITAALVEHSVEPALDTLTAGTLSGLVFNCLLTGVIAFGVEDNIARMIHPVREAVVKKTLDGIDSLGAMQPLHGGDMLTPQSIIFRRW